MTSIKSVVLNKTITDDGYIAEFYNPFWGYFAIDCKYDADTPAFNNMINLMRVGDYFLVSGKRHDEFDNDIREFSIVKYMSRETVAVRRSKRKLAIPNMSVREMDKLADDILTRLNYLPYQTELETVYDIINDKFYITNLSPNMRLMADLHMDSLDIIWVLMYVEENLKLPTYSLDIAESVYPYMTVGGLAKKIKRFTNKPVKTAHVPHKIKDKNSFLNKIKQKIRVFSK